MRAVTASSARRRRVRTRGVRPSPLPDIRVIVGPPRSCRRCWGCGCPPLLGPPRSWVSATEWRQPRVLRDRQGPAHREIATAVLAMQSLTFTSVWRDGRCRQADGDDLLTSLRRRAELRVADLRRRTTFMEVLDRKSRLFDDQLLLTLRH